MITIVIDPGHGGSEERGGSSPLGKRRRGTAEKVFTLRLAQRVAAHLGKGVRTQLTRERDVNLSLAERAAVAQRAGASVFVSLHSGGAEQGGCETWIHPHAGGSSRDLAWTLQREVSREAGGDRGVKAADLTLLRPELVGADAAACLLELDDLDRERPERDRWAEHEEAEERREPARLDRLGQAIARAIHRYLDAKRDLLRLLVQRGAGEVDSDDGEAYPVLGNPGRSRRRYGGWASDDVSPDYRHLVGITAGMSSEFSLDAAALQTLCDWNAFDSTPLGESGMVLFGLRGCRLTDSSYDGSFVTSLQLSEDLPDHQQNHCVLGVWCKSGDDAGKVAAFRGSTVPNLGSMRRFASGGEACNMLLTGRYTYHVGGHRPAGDALHLEGVFVEDAPPIVVIRSRTDTTYTTSDFYDLLNPGDNIHPSRDTRGESFSSEGCQTVRGGGDRAGNQLEHGSPPGWVKFRERAGLTPTRAPAWENGRPYLYVMLTGREARLAAAGASASDTRRLRQGSSGPAVSALQTVLAAEPVSRRYTGPVDGRMSGATVMAYVKRQQALDGGSADGIVTPAAAAAMGFDLETGAQIPTAPPAAVNMSRRARRYGAIYTGSANERENTSTVIDFYGELVPALRSSWQAEVGNDPSCAAASLLAAQIALETGWARHVHNYNLGNEKCGSDVPHVYFACTERFRPAAAARMQADATNGSLVTVANSTPDSAGNVLVRFEPPHPACRFRAFASLAEGVAAHFQLLRRRYRTAWPALESGDAAAFVDEIHRLGYFTEAVESYRRSVASIQRTIEQHLACDAQGTWPRPPAPPPTDPLPPDTGTYLEPAPGDYPPPPTDYAYA